MHISVHLMNFGLSKMCRCPKPSLDRCNYRKSDYPKGTLNFMLFFKIMLWSTFVGTCSKEILKQSR